jgi:hypothetical protein
VLGIFATWRVAHLLAHEDGPWDAVLRLRSGVGNGQWGRMLDCFHCLSLWIAAPIAAVVARDPVEWFLAWLGLSGAACLLERLQGTSPAIIQPLDLEGDDDGLLRTETRGAGEHRGQELTDDAGKDTGPIDVVRRSATPEAGHGAANSGRWRDKPADSRSGQPALPGTVADHRTGAGDRH